MALGRVPVEYPKCYKNPDVPESIKRELFETGEQYLWDPTLAQNQWWIDALTIDPAALLADRQVIWDKEMPQPVLESPVENASIGQLPAVAAYVAVHPDFGAHVFFPYHGAKYGGACKAEDGRMYEGFVWWWDSLSADTLELIKHRGYYNQEDAIEKLMSSGDEPRKRRWQGTFDPKNFLVRRRLHYSAPASLPAVCAPNFVARWAVSVTVGNPAVVAFRVSFLLALTVPCSRPLTSSPRTTICCVFSNTTSANASGRFVNLPLEFLPCLLPAGMALHGHSKATWLCSPAAHKLSTTCVTPFCALWPCALHCGAGSCSPRAVRMTLGLHLRGCRHPQSLPDVL